MKSVRIFFVLWRLFSLMIPGIPRTYRFCLWHCAMGWDEVALKRASFWNKAYHTLPRGYQRQESGRAFKGTLSISAQEIEGNGRTNGVVFFLGVGADS